MGIGRNTRFLALVIWASLTASVASAQTSQLEAPPLLPDLARIVERGTLVVAQLNGNLRPIFAEGEDGELAGFDIDLAKKIAKHLKVGLEIRRTAESYDEVVWQVAAGEADLGISFLSRSTRRAKHALFSRPYARQSLTLLINRVKGLKFHRSCPSVKELVRTAEFSGLVGLVSGSANAARLREGEPDAQPREFQSSEDLLEAVLAGEVAISLQGELVARRFLAEKPAARIRLQLCEIPNFQDQIAIAVPPGRYDLLHWINVFLEERAIDFDVQELVKHKGPWSF